MLGEFRNMFQRRNLVDLQNRVQSMFQNSAFVFCEIKVKKNNSVRLFCWHSVLGEGKVSGMHGAAFFCFGAGQGRGKKFGVGWGEVGRGNS